MQKLYESTWTNTPTSNSTSVINARAISATNQAFKITWNYMSQKNSSVLRAIRNSEVILNSNTINECMRTTENMSVHTVLINVTSNNHTWRNTWTFILSEISFVNYVRRNFGTNNPIIITWTCITMESNSSVLCVRRISLRNISYGSI